MADTSILGRAARPLEAIVVAFAFAREIAERDCPIEHSLKLTAPRHFSQESVGNRLSR